MKFTQPLIAVACLASIGMLISFNGPATAQQQPSNAAQSSSLFATQSRPTNPAAAGPRQNPYDIRYSNARRPYGNNASSLYPTHSYDVDQETRKKIQELSQLDRKMEIQSRDLLRHYGNAKDDDARKEVKAKITELVAKHFDSRQERRELELKSIEQRVKRLRETYDKRQQARQTIIDKRLDQLISEIEGLAF